MGKLAKCKYCGSEFMTSRKLRAYCSIECREQWDKEFREEYDRVDEINTVKKIKDNLTTGIQEYLPKAPTHIKHPNFSNIDFTPVLEVLIMDSPIKIDIDPSMKGLGSYNRETQEIKINDKQLSIEDTIGTIIHELTHYLIDTVRIPVVTNIETQLLTHNVQFDEGIIDIIKNEAIAYQMEQLLSFNRILDPSGIEETTYNVINSAKQVIEYYMEAYSKTEYFEYYNSEYNQHWFYNRTGNFDIDIKAIAEYYSSIIVDIIIELNLDHLYYVLTKLGLREELKTLLVYNI